MRSTAKCQRSNNGTGKASSRVRPQSKASRSDARSLSVVPMEGVEPTHPYGYQILSLARLPIPPHRPPIDRTEHTKTLALPQACSWSELKEPLIYGVLNSKTGVRDWDRA